jgi:alpha-N-arabinofuranosidase
MKLKMLLTRRKLVGSLPALYLTAAAAKLHAVIGGGREYHVSLEGENGNDGSLAHPLRTIAAAAMQAMPGDTITVHAGVYRERVDPPRGGTSAQQPITYQAAAGDYVEICGAEQIKGWKYDRGDVWTVAIPNTFFGTFNPYSDLIHGDWFDPKGREHHTGAVYLNSEWLIEAAALDHLYTESGETPLWFGRVDGTTTTLWTQFPGVDPNTQNVEINVRQSVFYPSREGRNYITVRGFRLRCAATPWAPPTAEQIGLIGTHWSKGWVIEDNIISHSICSGISLGKHGDRYDNTSKDSAEGYVKTIERATAHGWSKENIGSHTVRNNVVSHCEQAGIVGSLGCIFSTVTGNTVHDIHVRQLFYGEEMAGIKFHAAIDTEISGNHLHHCYRALWLDWMAQGTHVSRNVFRDNFKHDLFVEVDHGPFLVENNLFLSRISQRIDSQGGAYAHNLFCGSIDLLQRETRETPYMKPHSAVVAGLHGNPSGDMRFYNNLFAQGGRLDAYDQEDLPSSFGGNVFLHDAVPCKHEEAPLLKPEFDAGVLLHPTESGFVLQCAVDISWATAQARKVVTTELLGIASIPKLPFEHFDGSPIRLLTDYSGRPRNAGNPFPGPFEVTKTETLIVPILTGSSSKIAPSAR